jgi:hypothetical protein
MNDVERRLGALEMLAMERLALDPMPLLTELEDLIRAKPGEVAPAALELLARARGGFEPYAAGYGIPSPDEDNLAAP